MALLNLPGTLSKGLPHPISDAASGGPQHRVGLPKLPKALPAARAHGGGGGLKPLVPVHTPTSTTNAPAAAGGRVDPNDPFQFIKGLMAPTDIAQIRAMIDTVYGPQRDLINQQIAETAGQAKARADQMSQVYQAFAQYMGSLPDQIKNIYQQAGKDGYSAGQALMAGPGGGVQAELGKFDTINSNLLSQESANWQSYAAAQPGIYSLRATNDIKQMLGVAGQNENALRARLLDLSSKEADSILSYLQSAQAKDAQLQEWAYGQKQSQSNAQLLADQRAQQLAYNKYVTERQLGDKEAQAVALNDYRVASLRVREDSIAAANQRAALGRSAAAGRQNKSLAAKNQTPIAKVQAGLNATLAKIGPYASKLKAQHAPGGGSQSTSTNIYQKDKNGKIVKDKNGRPIVTGHKTTTGRVAGPPATTRARIWQLTYGNFSRQLFSYYRQLYPGLARQKGAIQKLVEERITAAVGWGPNG